MKTENMDRGKPFFNQLRTAHPLKIGDVINGERVASTFYKLIGDENKPCYTVSGDHKVRYCLR